MCRNEIKEKILELIISQEGVVVDDYFDEESNLAYGGMNSLIFVKILVNLEMIFDIEFEEDLIDAVNDFTLGSLIDYVQTKTMGKGEKNVY